ncbi:alanine--tRNA ligase [Cellvibrio japonicus]|uniref:Alanine--tRNA ligase n=1 Tax=Cellvibrio japonicus (strain Ueda107) TaxID=498211 RepID=B3PCZ6_CELJU|nr:alanine--tRNA ligase [Cellvibrio japonicus]ACE86343.1 alanyl-tRNA synthetase [Cellvibrio japonicus Ueda107]QEI11936.1 alanine--tRNA ligase [Cellvibrio japonicus]QEI15510.1 alanine--tRNA ligase [Cellvibrio japonicus]QEI19089.1 alanine--tRNA ligase [Cellvibrio japonicus]
MKSAEIRDAFLKYFESKGHTVVASSSLVPGNDPTLLFTNAGMNQFKDVFLGGETRSYTRAASSQRCVRAGGKHNDLENVGYTARHHTFFEMLGNFSFGDYFKRDAIAYAWEFLTSKAWLNIPAEKLWVTVYASDDEAYAIWHNEVGVPAERIIRIGDNKGAPYASDNFWAMGDTGPCGPCTEIFYDHGPDIWGGPPGSPEEDGDRYIEIWNNVFMQFNRTADGVLHPLPAPSVDTGMGLERISAVMQHVHSNYEIDLFQHLLSAAVEATGTSDLESKSLRVIADHIRSCSFLVSDGVLPSNEGRGYVLRRIIRRAIRHGNKLGQKQPFFHKLVKALAEVMGDAYPELHKNRAHIERVLLQEEEQFEKTLDKGIAVLEDALAKLSGTEIPGKLVFTLYDTYGFPVDLTNDIARERGLTIDQDGYDAAMAEQRARARAAGTFKVDYSAVGLDLPATEFLGYRQLAEQGKVVALIKDSKKVDRLVEGDDGVVVLDRTPFYAESGGQAGDCGYLEQGGNRLEVRDCQKQANAHLHLVHVLQGAISVGDVFGAKVDANVRQATALNHSATHLMHAALRKVLGEHVTQKGSLVDSERLRFDFSHFEAVTPEQLKTIETLVNDQVRANSAVATELCDMDTAKAKGAMALFGEKYGDTVRVLTMGDGFSVELCGGTHVARTGDIGVFRITSESGVAAGIRRIEAITGTKALALFDQVESLVDAAARSIKANRDNLLEKLDALVAQNRKLEKDLAGLKTRLATAGSGDVLSQAQDVNGIKVLALNLEGADARSLRDTVDQFKNKLGSAVVLLAAVENDKVSLVAGVTQDITAKVKAGDLMAHVAGQIGGKGGGRPDMAQGGGTDVARLADALASVLPWVNAQLG